MAIRPINPPTMPPMAPFDNPPDDVEEDEFVGEGELAAVAPRRALFVPVGSSYPVIEVSEVVREWNWRVGEVVTSYPNSDEQTLIAAPISLA